MGKTLILLFHPEYAKSKANRAMAEAAAAVEGVEVVNMATLYGDGPLDLDAEVARLYEADRLLLQFPIHWYCAPPATMAWQNAVLTRMFYVHPKDEGERLRGLPFTVAATAGNVPDAYSAEGVNRYPLAELLRPFEASASRCAFAWTEPFLTYGANRLDADGLAALGARYAAWLGDWTDGIDRAATTA